MYERHMQGVRAEHKAGLKLDLLRLGSAKKGIGIPSPPCKGLHFQPSPLLFPPFPRPDPREESLFFFLLSASARVTENRNRPPLLPL